MIETGGVEYIKKGDLVSVPFIVRGRCRMQTGNTGVCLNVNPDRPGSAYGYVDMGGWVGGQAEYALVRTPTGTSEVPRQGSGDGQDPRPDDAVGHLPDYYHGVHGRRHVGLDRLRRRAGPVGLAAAHSAQVLGAAVVIVGDLIPERLEQARSFGCEAIDVSKGDPKDQIEQILGVPEVDAAVDAVGFEARGHGSDADHEAPATVLNSIMDVTRVAGKLGIPGLYVTGDLGRSTTPPRWARCRSASAWARPSRTRSSTGQCPVMRHYHGLMQMILNDRCQIAKAVNATVVTLDDAPQGYKDFDSGVARSSCSTRTGRSR